MCVIMYKRPYYVQQRQPTYVHNQPFKNSYYSTHDYPVYEQTSFDPYGQHVRPTPPMTPFEQFSKPAQPMNWPIASQPKQSHDGYETHQAHLGHPLHEEYQIHQTNPQMPLPNQPQPPGLLSQFQDSNGQIDFNKMFSTVGQLANTVQQVSPVIKQFGSFMKNLR